nr:putative retrotransposon protein [Tanacetum cinerariifolium]
MLFTMHETYVYLDPKAIIHFFMRPAAIIDRQLPFEYTITSRSTDMVVPIPPAPAADSATNVLAEWNALYDAHNKVACLMLGNQLEHLGYVLPQDLTIGLILNGLTKDFARFVKNYNMHNMGKTIDELHAMLIEYEKGLPKRAETPQVRMIKGGKIQKSNKKSLKAKGKGKANGKGKYKQVYIPKRKNPKPAAKEHPAKDNTCHHYKEVGHCKMNYPAYLAELIKKKKQVGTGSSLNIFVIELFSFPSKSWVYDTSCGTLICNTQHGLRGVFKNEVENQLGKIIKAIRSDRGESATRTLNMVPTKKVDKTPYELWYGKVPNLSYLKVWGCVTHVKQDTTDKLQQRSVKCIFIGYPKETMVYYFYFSPENKIVVASLKQASRSWNKRFDEKIKKFGFAQNLEEPCVYQKGSGSNVTFLILYVHDIIIMGNHIPSLQSVKDYLGKCFAMKDLGEATFILGIKIYRDRSKQLIGLAQNAYMEKILKRYKIDNSKRGHIPMKERLDLNKTQGASTPKEVKRMQNLPYALAVGFIMYAVRCTRPDVAFA